MRKTRPYILAVIATGAICGLVTLACLVQTCIWHTDVPIKKQGEDLDWVRSVLSNIETGKMVPTTGFAKLRDHAASNTTDWHAVYVYLLGTFEAAPDAAVDYVDFLCFLGDLEIFEADKLASDMIVTGPSMSEQAPRLGTFLSQSSLGPTRRDRWKVIAADIVEVKSSQVFEFVFVVKPTSKFAG